MVSDFRLFLFPLKKQESAAKTYIKNIVHVTLVYKNENLNREGIV